MTTAKVTVRTGQTSHPCRSRPTGPNADAVGVGIDDQRWLFAVVALVFVAYHHAQTATTRREKA
ncbi:MAG TPA: hypothetical protein VN688_14140 [Gemmataceae bacterium]|nr:hypothetical protein [Gemmataceae bacterium]